MKIWAKKPPVARGNRTRVLTAGIEPALPIPYPGDLQMSSLPQVYKPLLYAELDFLPFWKLAGVAPIRFLQSEIETWSTDDLVVALVENRVLLCSVWSHRYTNYTHVFTRHVSIIVV